MRRKNEEKTLEPEIVLFFKEILFNLYADETTIKKEKHTFTLSLACLMNSFQNLFHANLMQSEIKAYCHYSDEILFFLLLIELGEILLRAVQHLASSRAISVYVVVFVFIRLIIQQTNKKKEEEKIE